MGTPQSRRRTRNSLSILLAVTFANQESFFRSARRGKVKLPGTAYELAASKQDNLRCLIKKPPGGFGVLLLPPGGSSGLPDTKIRHENSTRKFAAGRGSGRVRRRSIHFPMELGPHESPGCCCGCSGCSSCGCPTGSSWRCCSSYPRGSPGSSLVTAHRHLL